MLSETIGKSRWQSHPVSDASCGHVREIDGHPSSLLSEAEIWS